jgi:hypothetical protein
MFFDIHISVPRLDLEDAANLSSVTKEETSVHVLCECEALASLRHAYLGSYFLDREGVTNLNMGVTELGKGTWLL